MAKSNKQYSKIYGWEEQNEVSFGVKSKSVNINPVRDGIDVNEDGKLYGRVVPEGCWYLTYIEAHRAVIKHWVKHVKEGQKVLQTIRKAKITRHSAGMECGTL